MTVAHCYIESMSVLLSDLDESASNGPFDEIFTPEQIRIWISMFGDEAPIVLLGLQEDKSEKVRELLLCAKYFRLRLSDFLLLGHFGSRIIEGICDPEWSHNFDKISPWPGSAALTSWPSLGGENGGASDCWDCVDGYWRDTHYETDFD